MTAKGIFVTGTDTGVGKTIIAGAIVGLLRAQGMDVGVMKPVQSGALVEDGRLVSEDARFLLKAAQVDDELDLVNPYCLEPALSPNVAAAISGIAIDPGVIREAFLTLAGRHEVVIVEGAGGLLVPISDDFLVADLVRLLALPIVVVARPGLGTINHSLLTLRCAQHLSIKPLGTVINGYDQSTAGEAERTSPAVIARLSKVPLLGIVPRLPAVDVATAQLGNLIEVAGRCLSLDPLREELHGN